MELSKNIHFNFSRKEKIQPLNPPWEGEGVGDGIGEGTGSGVGVGGERIF